VAETGKKRKIEMTALRMDKGRTVIGECMSLEVIDASWIGNERGGRGCSRQVCVEKEWVGMWRWIERAGSPVGRIPRPAFPSHPKWCVKKREGPELRRLSIRAHRYDAEAGETREDACPAGKEENETRG
jgi:hypothetical protein